MYSGLEKGGRERMKRERREKKKGMRKWKREEKE